MARNAETTKHCPHCGNTALALLRTLNIKYCVGCHIRIPWYLEPGQKRIV